MAISVQPDIGILEPANELRILVAREPRQNPGLDSIRGPAVAIGISTRVGVSRGGGVRARRWAGRTDEGERPPLGERHARSAYTRHTATHRRARRRRGHAARAQRRASEAVGRRAGHGARRRCGARTPTRIKLPVRHSGQRIGGGSVAAGGGGGRMGVGASGAGGGAVRSARA